MFVKYLVVMFGPAFCVLVSTVLPNIFRFPPPPKKKNKSGICCIWLYICHFCWGETGFWLLFDKFGSYLPS